MSPEQRERVVVVVVDSDLYGVTSAVMRRLSADGVVLEMCYLPPLGAVLQVRFLSGRDDDAAVAFAEDLVARAEVVAHLAPNGRERAVGLRFIEFVDNAAELALASMH